MDKLQRFNPWPIFIYNSRAVRELDGRRSASLSERLLLYGVPIGSLALFTLMRWQLGGVTQLLSAISLLVGAMLSTFVFLANLRIKIEESDNYRVRPGLKRLVASSAVGALHVSLVAMLLSLLLATVTSWPLLTAGGRAANIASGLCVAMLVHLIVSLAAVLRRLLGIYVDLFLGDFMASPEPDN
ncbi:hypothetical protein [Nocardia transvalensis]|uniref:hypothetical protein n=1 Tax=Nocardia transvalensis TaxID=37333 RepID=UPI001894D38A|nr:hypothetical protein [Nocardia transvalensis]MBF6332799.1 hypothetical protein [Nocardia transvalensis]